MKEHERAESEARPPRPTCGGRQHGLGQRAAEYRVLACDSCRLGPADPMRVGDREYYRIHLVCRQSDATAVVAQHRRSAISRANRRLLSMVSEGGRVLDVGCGYVGFVRFRLDLGYDARRLDVNEEHPAAGQLSLERGDRLSTLETSVTCGNARHRRAPSTS